MDSSLEAEADQQGKKAAAGENIEKSSSSNVSGPVVLQGFGIGENSQIGKGYG